MNRTCLISTLALLFVPCGSHVLGREQALQRTEFSGEGLIQQFKGERPYPAPQEAVGRALSVEYASGFMSGVAISQEGTTWCNKSGVAPHEIKERVQTYIEQLSPQRRAEDAHRLIVEALKKLYPCK